MNKRSKQVGLILLGTLGASTLTGCQDSQANSWDNVDVFQKTYTSVSDCVEDWGKSWEEDCKKPASSGGYAGPRYYWNHAGGYPMAFSGNSTEAKPVPGARIASGVSKSVRTWTGKPSAFGMTSAHTASAVKSGIAAPSARGGWGSSARGVSMGG